MVGMITSADVTALPLEPKNPLPYWRRLAAARRFDMGLESLRDAGGPVTRNVLAPRWDAALGVRVVTAGRSRRPRSPRCVRRTRGDTDGRGSCQLAGDNLLVVSHQEWLPRRRSIGPVLAVGVVTVGRVSVVPFRDSCLLALPAWEVSMWSPRAAARRNDMDADQRVAQNRRRSGRDTPRGALVGVSAVAG